MVLTYRLSFKSNARKIAKYLDLQTDTCSGNLSVAYGRNLLPPMSLDLVKFSDSAETHFSMADARPKISSVATMWCI